MESGDGSCGKGTQEGPREAPREAGEEPAVGVPEPQEQSGGRIAADERWDCTICMEEAHEPVISMCGHLFCWPCIYRWLEQHNDCPVCKAELTRDKLVPLYGRGAEAQRDPREQAVPQRPAGQHAPAPQRRNQAIGAGAQFGFPEFYFSAGTGFGNMFTVGFPQGHEPNVHLTPEQRAQQAKIAKWMFVVAVIVLLMIMFGV